MPSAHEFPFAVAVGNPPYQTGKVGDDPTLIQKSPVNIFHMFQNVSEQFAESTSLVYPGGRWASRARGEMDAFGGSLMNNPSLREVWFWTRSFELFGSGTEISGGVSVVHVDQSFDNGGSWRVVTSKDGVLSSGSVLAPGDDSVSMFPVLNKLSQTVKKVEGDGFVPFTSRKLPFSVFGLESSFAVRNPEKVTLAEGEFSDNAPDSMADPVLIMVNDGEGKSGRATWFWVNRTDLPTAEKNISHVDSWKVLMSAKNINGLNGRACQVEVVGPPSAHSFVRVSVAAFDTEDEARNCFKWMGTDFVRCLIAASGSLVGSFAVKVPDPGCFQAGGSSDLPYDKGTDALNDALFARYGLGNEEKAEARQFAAGLSPFTPA